MRDTFATRSPLTVGHEDFTIFSLARLGERFDLKAFHDVILGGGPMPLPVLEEQVGLFINANAR